MTNQSLIKILFSTFLIATIHKISSSPLPPKSKYVKCKWKKYPKVGQHNHNNVLQDSIILQMYNEPEFLEDREVLSYDDDIYYDYDGVEPDERRYWSWKLCDNPSTPTLSPIHYMHVHFPTPKPTPSPTYKNNISNEHDISEKKPNSLLPWCQSLLLSKVYKTNLHVTASFNYELLVLTSLSLNLALSQLKLKLRAYLNDFFLDCITKVVDRNLISHSTHLQIHGIDIAKSDSNNNKTTMCKHLHTASPELERCYVIQSSLTLYLQEATSEEKSIELAVRVLKQVQLVIMADKSILIEPTYGIMDLFYINGSLNTPNTNGNHHESNKSVVESIQPHEKSSVGESLSKASISIIIIACVAAAAVTAFIVHKKFIQDIQVHGKKEEDDVSFASTGRKWESKRLFSGSTPMSDDATDIFSSKSSINGDESYDLIWYKSRSADIIKENDIASSLLPDVLEPTTQSTPDRCHECNYSQNPSLSHLEFSSYYRTESVDDRKNRIHIDLLPIRSSIKDDVQGSRLYETNNTVVM